jgi:flagellar biosynthesis protein FlhF
MRLKSYFAESVDQALSRASRELGPDAMLVYSREAHAEARYLGSYEVVFTVPASKPQNPTEAAPAISGPSPEALFKAMARNADDFAETSAGRASSSPTTALKANEDLSVEKLSVELAVMRRQMERMMTALSRGTNPSSAGEWKSGLMAGLDPLLQAGVSDELVERIANHLSEQQQTLQTPGEGDLTDSQALRRELGAMFSVDARLGVEDAATKIVAVVGPPGSGKTLTLVKLAVAYGLKGRKPVQLISMDTWRVGGAEQLRSFAAILGVGFQALETTGALAQALEEHRHKDLILIDTPGLSGKDLDASDELASFLRSRADVDTHLTLTPSMKSADLRVAVDRYERFRPTKLLLTKVDETNSLGTGLNEAARTGKPISFLTKGQAIPEDLEEATKDRILDLVLGSRFDSSDWDRGLTPAERRAAAA